MDPIKEFCDALWALPEDERYELVSDCNIAIGLPKKPTGVEPTPHTPENKVYFPSTVDDLQAHMRHLVDNVRLDESFLINGLLNHYIGFYEYQSDSQVKADQIDQNLDLMEHYQEELKKPVPERSHRRSDEELRELISLMANSASSLPKNRERAKRITERMQELRDGYFTREYWDAFNEEALDKEMEELEEE